MIERSALAQMQKLMRQFPAVVILGPRQSGKTTLARQFQKKLKRKSIYLDLELPSDRRQLEDPEFFFRQFETHTIILDEVQRMPELFSILRPIIDRKRTKGRFLLLGSSSLEMVKNVSESLAGRIIQIEVPPLSLKELGANSSSLYKHWFRGGFPDAWLARNENRWADWMGAFYKSYIERDLNFLFGRTFSAPLMGRLWKMMAHHHGQVLNVQSFSKGLDISPTTVSRYIDALQGAFIFRALPSYHFNSGKRLIKSPKIYIRDSGLLHYLLDMYSNYDLWKHPSVGYSWEGYVIEEICKLLPEQFKPYFYRTQDGAEVDLVLVKGIKPYACIGVKSGSEPKVSKGLNTAMRDLQTLKNFIIIPENDKTYLMQPGLKCCSLNAFLNKELPALINSRTPKIKTLMWDLQG